MQIEDNNVDKTDIYYGSWWTQGETVYATTLYFTELYRRILHIGNQNSRHMKGLQHPF